MLASYDRKIGNGIKDKKERTGYTKEVAHHKVCRPGGLKLRKTIKDIKEKTIVRFTRGKLGHWVVVENGEVVFNSLSYSRCVEEGNPSECRILKISGGF